MTVQEFLDRATTALKQAGIASARLDTLILLEDALGRDRAQLLANPDSEISPPTEVGLNTKVAQRAKNLPLAYIRNKVEFYGHEFVVDQHVLVPRPETEAIIDLLQRLELGPRGGDITIADIGTGSGAIAITAKLELPAAHVIATDIDPKALQTARQNATKLGADITFQPGDLLDAIPRSSRPTIILANLPYVPEDYPINEAARHEPKLALFAGRDGLDLYRRFWQQVGDLTDKPAYILTESLKQQHELLEGMAKAAGYQTNAAEGLIQQFKYVG